MKADYENRSEGYNESYLKSHINYYENYKLIMHAKNWLSKIL